MLHSCLCACDCACTYHHWAGQQWLACCQADASQWPAHSHALCILPSALTSASDHPTARRWPTRGYTFATWLRLEAGPEDDDDEGQGGAGGGGAGGAGAEAASPGGGAGRRSPGSGEPQLQSLFCFASRRPSGSTAVSAAISSRRWAAEACVCERWLLLRLLLPWLL